MTEETKHKGGWPKGKPRKSSIEPTELPEIISMAVIQEGPLFKTLKIHSKGKEIYQIEEGEANLKPIAIQEMKVAFVKLFLNPNPNVITPSMGVK
jgi:hypothetical protein